MRLSVNKLRHIKVAGANLVPGTVDELVEKIGAQLGAVEEVIPFGEKFARVIIVTVVACEKHPDADKLNLCLIDDGSVVKDVERDEQGYVQVVCGAPNVRPGMLAAWLPPGATVPSSAGTAEPFVLEAREIRGKVSNGMLASPKELGISENHEGILEVDEQVEPGTSFTKTYRLEGEVILDIENKMFTHRPDCFGMLGIAREVAGIQQQAFQSPAWYVANPALPEPEEADKLSVKIVNELSNLVPRFTAVAMSNIEVKHSPVWLQIALTEAGIRPINNIVDYTNFYMLETGQPLHAYDYDKVKALSNNEATIVVRNPKPGEKVKLLNGKELEPRAEAIMIATDKQLIGIGGVMGGADTEVDENTKNIILECANFDMYSIRRTSMAHGLFTDAVTRFNKGQSPLQNLAVLAEITRVIQEDAGGKVAGQVLDDNHLDQALLERNSLHPPVTVTTDFINTRLGLELAAEDMKKLLENVEFAVSVAGDQLTVKAPFWRTDIELREDVVEEIGRLYGYDHLPLELPRRDLTPAPKDQLLSTKAAIREKLAQAGASEVLSYSFVHGDLLRKVGQDPAKAYRVANALSPDLQYFRISLLPSLLEKVHPNIKVGYDEFVLFEIGKTHNFAHQPDEDGLPREYEATALVVAAADKLKKQSAAYYEARKYLEFLVGRENLDFKPVAETMNEHQVVQPFDLARTALVYTAAGQLLGLVGEFKSSVTHSLKLPRHTAGFEVDTMILQALFAEGHAYQPLSRFPSVKQDLTLRVRTDIPYADVHQAVLQALSAQTEADMRQSVELLDIYQNPDDTVHVHLTFRFTVTHMKRTLTDQVVNKLLDDVAAELKAKINAERI